MLSKAQIYRTLAHLRNQLSIKWYELDGNALRFTVRTIKDLPGRPPIGQRRLVLFAHYDPQGKVDEYVRFYLECLFRSGSAVVLVSGSADLTAESAAAIAPFCAGIYTRRTLGLDFGSWHLAWHQLHSRGWRLEEFDQFLLANDSVYGPLFPLEEMFAAFQGADMYGATESMEYVSHLQSYFLLWALNERSRAFLERFWLDFRYILDKDELVQACEIGISRKARESGLSQKAYRSDEAVRAAVDETQAQSEEGRPCVNNTIDHWQVLISRLRFPFLKTAVLKRKDQSPSALDEFEGVLRRHTGYDPALIANHLRRLGLLRRQGKEESR